MVLLLSGILLRCVRDKESGLPGASRFLYVVRTWHLNLHTKYDMISEQKFGKGGCLW